MRRQLRWYGASPLHLLAMLACFGLAGYAATRLISSKPLGVIAWFLGAVIGHDLLLMPLYSLADRSIMAAIRHREPQLPAGPWINYIRVPAGLSALLLLVWFPLILRLQSPYHASTTLSADPYVWHWLAVTGVLFLLSAVAFALRLRVSSRNAEPPERLAAATAVTRPELPGSTSPELPSGTSPELPSGTSLELDGGHENASGVPGQAAPGQPDPPAVLAEGEPEQDTGEVTSADGDRSSPISDPRGTDQPDGRPADQVPPIQPGGEPE